MERECRKEGERHILLCGYTYERKKRRKRISQEESVEINEQTLINNNTIIDKLYIKVKQIISNSIDAYYALFL